MPEGIEYVAGSSKKFKKVNDFTVGEPTIIPNYKQTGKTALIFDIADVTRYKHYDHSGFKFDIQVTSQAIEGDSRIDSFVYWEEAKGLRDKWNTFVDKYDFDNDGNKTERFYQIGSTKITYTQRKDIVLKNTLSDSATGNFASTAQLDVVGEEPYYKFMLFNNYIQDMQRVSMIATLPQV